MTSPYEGYKDAMLMIVSRCISTLDSGSIDDIDDLITDNIQLINYLSLKVRELQAKRKQIIMAEQSDVCKVHMVSALSKEKQESKEAQIGIASLKT